MLTTVVANERRIPMQTKRKVFAIVFALLFLISASGVSAFAADGDQQVLWVNGCCDEDHGSMTLEEALMHSNLRTIEDALIEKYGEILFSYFTSTDEAGYTVDNESVIARIGRANCPDCGGSVAVYLQGYKTYGVPCSEHPYCTNILRYANYAYICSSGHVLDSWSTLIESIHQYGKK